MLSSKSLLSLLMLAAVPRSYAAAPDCPYLGPDFPKPTELSTNEIMKAAFSNLTSVLDAAINTEVSDYGNFKANTNSWSIQIFDTQSSTPLYQNHHTQPNLTSLSSVGVNTVDENSVFRLGSLTKLLSIYTFLILDGDTHFQEPITKYVPELAALAKTRTNAVNDVQWEDVTLGDLASQLSGIGRDNTAIAELSQTAGFPPATFALPPLNESRVAPCGLTPLCTRTQFFETFVNRHPFFPSSNSPMYSNVAYQVLSYALENITGVDIQTSVDNSVIKPLELTHTSWDAPNASVGVIPGDFATTWWGVSLGDETPAGGAYGSTSDLSTLGRAILTSKLLSGAQTRRWLKPKSFTSDPLQSVGAPWEIQRVELSNPFRILDVYTKSGDIGAYSSDLVLIPDYDIGFGILGAGDDADTFVQNLVNIVGGVVIPAAETAAREEAGRKYSGSYKSSALNSSLTIETNSESLGLGISKWISNGTDMFTILGAGFFTTQVTPNIRLYPTGLETTSGGITSAAFRAVFGDPNAAKKAGLFARNCIAWILSDTPVWEGVAFGEFLFERDSSDGHVLSISPRAWEETYVKV